MKRIALLVPYYGKFPDHFDFWRKTARYNSTIDFYIISDSDTLFDENNIFCWKISFEEIVERIQRVIPYKIALTTPYKLSNFRPVFGKVFSNELKEYDYWGTCELDLILGDLRSFWTDDVLDQYEKFGILGHLQLYKNIDKINSLYLSEKTEGCLKAKQAFTNPYPSYFEEICGMYLIAKNEGINIFSKFNYADLDPKSYSFQGTIRDEDGRKTGRTGQIVFTWEAGHLFEYSHDGRREIIYAHFPKRKMAVRDIERYISEYIIYANVISGRNKIDMEEINDRIAVDDEVEVKMFIKRARSIIWRGRLQRYCSIPSILNTMRIKRIMRSNE